LTGLLAPGPFEARGQRALPSVRPFAPRYRRALLRPLLTSRSAFRRRPFRREARPPQVRPSAFAAPPPDLRRLPFGRKSFAVMRPLALGDVASYPVPVRQPAVPLPASFSTDLAVGHLAVRSGPCDQVPGGLAPPCRVSCWAHAKKGGSLRSPPRSFAKGAALYGGPFLGWAYGQTGARGLSVPSPRLPSAACAPAVTGLWPTRK